MPTLMNRLTDWMGFTLTHLREADTPTGITPPPRGGSVSYVSTDAALSIGNVYRACQIIATSVKQLSGDQYRGDHRVDLAPIAAQPDPEAEAPLFFEETAMSLALCGNAYWRQFHAHDGRLLSVKLLNPAEVTVTDDPVTGKPSYSWRGISIPARNMRHLKLMRVPGRAVGLGPVQSAQVELRGAIEARDYGSKWLTETDVPSGILTSDQPINQEKAKEVKERWRRGDGDEHNGHDVRVLGNGLKYTPLLLKPSDVQFLETRQFTTTEVARLFGIPASIFLAAVQGTPDTYSNVEQEWIAFVRFTLMAYLREIEVHLSALLPRGNRFRFNVDGLLRTDTKTRYEAHKIALRWSTLDEIRAHENLPPLTAEQRTEIDAYVSNTPKDTSDARR